MSEAVNILRLKRLGIDTQREAVIYMNHDCPVCHSEGLFAHARVQVSLGGKSIIATLHHVSGDLLAADEVGLSEAAWRELDAEAGVRIVVCHPPPLTSMSRVRAKIYGERLSYGDFGAIVDDIVTGRYSDIHLSSFITGCTSSGLDPGEIVDLTRAMVDAGERLDWGSDVVVDKHCVGGLPGNRTTPIIVAIAAACGLTMPKTSSRAITSPAGTADTMETLAPVDLDIATMRRVVERHGGCVIWGGAVQLSPADDIFIRVERALDIDSDGQLIASVISKKLAAGATHLVLDIPVGPTAKVRTVAKANALSKSLREVSTAMGLRIHVVRTDGRQPVGRSIGPSLEARDVLAVLEGASHTPADLRERAVGLAGALLELGGVAEPGQGELLADQTLASGRAWAKFQAICEAQGGMRTPTIAPHRHPVPGECAGTVMSIDNRRLAMIAKLAGAPHAKAAGIELHARLGTVLEPGEPIYTVHAETRGELAYALDYVRAQESVIELGESVS